MSVPAEDPPAPGAATAVESLRAAFASGLTRPLAWRLGQLDALVALLGEQEGAIEEALRCDLGKPPVEAYLTDVATVRREVQALRRGLPRWMRDEAARVPWVLHPGRAWIRRDPLGVVVVVAPWNYPVNLVLVPLAAALAAGNCVVAKPSELAPAASRLLAGLLPRYLDERAVRVVEGGAEVTTELVGSGVDHVLFTGSGRVGRLIAEQAARRLVPVTLELGGKSPAVVAQDAEVEVAARRIVWGRFLNAGQTCVAPDYVLVEEGVREEFLAAATRAVTTLYGADPRSSPDYGRIVNDAHLARLERLLATHGGEVVVGGTVEHEARYVAPTVIAGPDPDSELMSEEIFGPVLPVLAVASLEEAARFVADRPTPLALYVFTAERARLERLLDATRSGAVAWNTTVEQFAVSSLPFGGVGASGTGRYHGRSGYETFSNLRPVFARPTWPDVALVRPPYRRVASALIRRIV